MPVSNQLRNQHLLWRAGFGPMAQKISAVQQADTGDLLNTLIKYSSGKTIPLQISNNAFDGLVKGIQDLGKLQKLSKEEKKKFRKQSVDELKNLNLYWLDEMVKSEAQLREKMSLFWHGHFACRVINIFFQQQLINTIRDNALENFGDLLRGVSKSPAMLSFLNNQQNKKQHPNENFAREVMELFSMGRGNYTEEDIKEAARAFTGWGFNNRGEFVNRAFFHDNGVKKFLGRSGNFDGDDIIDILLEEKQTAQFITRKVYRYFVNENVNEEIATALANRFYQGDYNINSLLSDIYTSEWFYDKQNIGKKIKSPVELIAGIRRMMPMEFENPQVQILLQKNLGQLLFYPPNVAGWPGGKTWIDSNALMLRLKMPRILIDEEELTVEPKRDDDTMMGGQDHQYRGRRLLIHTDWPAVHKMYADVTRANLYDAVAESFLQVRMENRVDFPKKYADEKDRDTYIKTSMINIMSTPEYQLC